MKVRELGLAALALLAGCGGQPEETGAVVAAPTSGPSAASTSATPATSQAAACEAEETTIYACTMQNGKALSVCSRGGDTATYRYGGSPPELVLQGGRWARVGYSGGGELQIAFDNGDTQYVVFGRTIRTGFDERGNNPVSSDGVIVLRNGRFADMQLCRADSDESDYSEASEAAMQRLPQSEELFTDETIRAALQAMSDDPKTHTCWLCARPLGDIVQWHHPVPKAKKGKVKVPVHPICHKTIHANFTNNELARIGDKASVIRDNAAIAKFVAWVANKPADFDAPTR